MAKGNNMDRKSIAHEVLVELLVHQFAFPVQWVETQNRLFSGRKAVGRYVELGPSKTLIGMGQKTVARKIASGAISADTHVQFLASTQDTKELSYEYDAPPEPESDGPVETSPPSEVSHSLSEATTIVPTVSLEPVKSPSHPSMPSLDVAIEDVPPSGLEVIRALIARKLKKPIAQTSPSKSVKELCGGKSTLQNELIGDFHNEFSTLPDKPEDLPLKDFGAAVSSSDTSFKLGKTSAALVARLVSSKMPASFNGNSIQAYLAEKWGLGPLRHTSVLLFALASEPQSRLPSAKAAEQFFDGLVSQYSEACGISLQVRLHKAEENTNAVQMVDSAALAAFSKNQKQLVKKQLKVLGEFLQSDSPEQSSILDGEALVVELQRKIDAWTAEYSEDFLLGISPVFDAKMIRRYNSWWNTARQDVLKFYHSESYKSLIHDDAALEIFLDRLRGRADEALLVLAQNQALSSYPDHEDVSEFETIFHRIEQAIASGIRHNPKVRPVLPVNGPRVNISDDGSIEVTETSRPEVSGRTAYANFLLRNRLHGCPARSKFAFLKSIHSDHSSSDKDLTRTLTDNMFTALKSGVSFHDKAVLVTGAGQGSIGSEVVRILLQGGARVVVTTSRDPSTTAKYFQRMYEEHGAKGSELHLVQFNQASAKDCERLIDYIYDPNGLEMDLDGVLPFAAASEGGIELDGLTAQSEFTHRLMLINLFRLLGRIVKNKKEQAIDCNPTQVLLPLSPNHGTFGGDGLYPESKLALGSLYNRVKSESWSDELSICGVRIGWTRSTGLMTGNDVVAEAVEKNGVLTFSAQEMAFNIAMLLTPEIVELCEDGPIEANFDGGLGALPNCHAILEKARAELNLTADIARAIKKEDGREREFLKPTAAEQNASPLKPKSRLQVGFPRLPSYIPDIEPLSHLQGLKDPSSAVVIVGFSELGPWGSSRLRWEMEKQGKLTQTGYVEMAWLMNLIQHRDGPRKDGYYVGWVDTKSGEPVSDADVEKQYGDRIASHAGIRFVKPESGSTYDPSKKEYLQEIAIEEDLPEFEASVSTAEALKLKHGDKVSVQANEGGETCKIQLKRGASIMIPKTIPFTWGSVAGLLPNGWNPAKYGIPEDLIHQLDPASLYAICCVSEAFFSAGITNPLEIFKHIHLSEIGNMIGSSMGGALKTKNLYRDIYHDKEIQADVLQETYLNTTAAWINMLLLGSTGPIKTPVGACATGVESIDSGFESIMAGKTKMCIVGGYDDFQEDESFGFSKMKATVNVVEELAKGRLPAEMSRPTAESRAGFVESHGCGVQILCRGDMALEMGLPVYGIIAGSAMAADKIGRSVPAPGQGILTFARETSEPTEHPLLGVHRLREAENGSRVSLYSAADDASNISSDYVMADTPSEATLSTPSSLALRNGVDHRHLHARLRPATELTSPLRAALAAWGLTIDDVDVASLHGTSTKANDVNEPDVICKQMLHLGRTPGKPLWAICQKSVTGHPKAPAAAWMLNGCLQVLDSGLIPGNRNADNIDPKLREFHHLCFPTQTIQTKGVKAFILTSFGFGQKSGQVIGVAPRYFFATLTREEFEEYAAKVKRRKALADRAYAKAVMSNSIVRIQDHPAYDESDATRVFLDPLSRISSHAATNSFRFDTHDIRNTSDAYSKLAALSHKAPHSYSNISRGLHTAAHLSKSWLEERMRYGLHPGSGVGVDLVDLSSFMAHNNAVFIERNYTERERDAAGKALNNRSFFAGRWAAKEAVFKCLRVASKGAGAGMRDIEVIGESSTGRPVVKLYGDAANAAKQTGIEDTQLSLSYGEDCVIAVALGISG